MDVSDIFLAVRPHVALGTCLFKSDLFQLTKMFNYLQWEKTKNITFAVFLCVWT